MSRASSVAVAGYLALAATFAFGTQTPASENTAAAIADPAPAFYIDAVTDAGRAFLDSLDADQR